MSEFDEFITFCPTADLQATTHFYHQVLGLPIALEQSGCRVFRVRPDAYIGFCEKSEPPTEPPQGLMLTLVADDVDGWHDQLKSHNVVIDKAPALNERYQIYHLFARDPNGYVIEIQRFEDPRWHQQKAESLQRG